MEEQMIDGALFASLLKAGAANLRRYMQTVNNLNVFPIPDGDTGNNMLLTFMGGVDALQFADDSISSVSRRAADGMLLSARGNSGVILSQLFDGIAKGLEGLESADTVQLGKALKNGVKHAYSAVMEPTEGTILTVARCAVEYANACAGNTILDYCNNYLHEAKRTLDRTPEMLSVLKKAGVVDSGGAGLVYIVEGVCHSLSGKEIYTEDELIVPKQSISDINIDLFTEDSILDYGYCTELLLRLQNSKTNPETFDVSIITEYLKKIGDSVVAFKTGSIVKIHVHTMTPDKVLCFCQIYGEFLTLKIENMSLQHNNVNLESININVLEETECKKYGIVAVCAGDGIKEMFYERGADVIVDGGQSLNPSTEDFLKAFREVNAENIIVLPNNSNVFLSAKQAAKMFEDADVFVLESKTIGDGYAALSMFNPNEENIYCLMNDIREAMRGVVTAEIAPCIRAAKMDDVQVHFGDYISVVGKEYIVSGSDRLYVACQTVDKLELKNYDICIIIRGKDVSTEECEKLEVYIHNQYPYKEIFVINGMQNIYDYIMILQ